MVALLSCLLLATSASAATLRGGQVGVDYPTTGTNTLDAGGGGKCSYKYSSHDGSPVVTGAKCEISKADLDTGSEPQPTERDYVHKLGGHDGCSDDDAGHILANRLGGKAVPTNLFPQEPHLNRGEWESFERAVYACVKDSDATLEWTFTYSSSKDQRPSKATYKAAYASGGCDDASKTFENPCDSASRVAVM